MAIGTNNDILGKQTKYTEPQERRGRPKVNRDLVIANLKSKDELGNPRYTLTQVAKLCKCSRKTVQRIRDEALEDGLIDHDYLDQEVMGIVEAELDSECIRAKGYSFKGWLETRFKNEKQAHSYFNFTSKVWDQLWNKCNLEEFADSKSQLGDQMALKFIETFKEDAARMRDRLKRIRFLMRFLGRGDINDRFFTMDNTKHPRAKRQLPEIEFTDFPEKFIEAVDLCVSYYPPEDQQQVKMALWLKLSSQMRTGVEKDERELFGLRKGTDSASYIVMSSPDEWKIHIFAKKGEHWDIIWLPPRVAQWVWERYNEINDGDQFLSISVHTLRKNFRKATRAVIGRGFILHDLRKVSLTWFYCNEIPLEVATNLNVGWKDLNTATGHYLNLKPFLRGSKRQEYCDKIPQWWKEGLDDFKGFEATIPHRG